MTKQRIFWILAALAATACSTKAPAISPPVISPGTGTLLTCSQTTFSANETVDWSSSAGTITDGGVYTSPSQTGTATITATPPGDVTESSSVTEALVTAVAGAKQSVQTEMNFYPEIYQHATASLGTRVYAVGEYQLATNGGPGVEIVVSDDNGTTFSAPVTATPLIPAATGGISCAAVAVDPVNPDLVYVIFNFQAGSGLAQKYIAPGNSDEGGLGLVVSTDGAKTFPQMYVLQAGDSGDSQIPVAQGICPDVTTPKPNAVAVETPGGSNELSDGNPLDMFLWVDTNQGAGFTVAQNDGTNEIANEQTGVLEAIDADIAQNSGNDGPRLFSDGNGTLCVTYAAFQPLGSNVQTAAVWVQCSTDLGQTFTMPAAASETIDTAGDNGGSINQPTGTFGPNGQIAIAWFTTNPRTVSGAIVGGVSVSTDHGMTFTDVSPVLYQDSSSTMDGQDEVDLRYDSTGVLWLAYGVYDGIDSPLAVDKTCDDGTTWSGPVLLNEPGGSVDNSQEPSLVPTTNGIAVYSQGQLADSTNEMRRYTLTP